VIYAYKNEETGEIIDCEFPMGEAPKTVSRHKKVYHRFFGNTALMFGANWHNEGQIKFKRGPIESDHNLI